MAFVSIKEPEETSVNRDIYTCQENNGTVELGNVLFTFFYTILCNKGKKGTKRPEEKVIR